MVDELIEAIREAPDDDGPRRVWADRLLDAGEPWGELVHIQCDLADGDLARHEAVALRRRERALIREHGARRAGRLGAFAKRWSFRRGLLEEAHVPAQTLAAYADEIFGAAPMLRRIDLGNIIESAHGHASMEAAVAPIFEALSRALACPQLEQLEALAFGLEVAAAMDPRDRRGNTAASTFPVDADALPRLIAAAPRLLRLKVLSTGPLSAAAVATLAESPLMRQLEHLRIRDNAASVCALLDRFAPDQLRSLCIDGYELGDQLARVFAHPALAALEELRIAGSNRHRDAWRDAVQLPQLASLRRLAIRNTTAPEVVVAVGDSAALANLVELELSGVLPHGIPPLDTAKRLDSLRVLRLRNRSDTFHAHRALTWPCARRLEIVDVRCSGDPVKELVERARAYDGIVLYSPSYHEKAVDTDLRGWADDAAQHPGSEVEAGR